jgi:hypothetical protein
MAGFGADIFMGMFDDSKYVSEVAARAEKQSGKVKPQIEALATAEAIQQARTALGDAETVEELRAVYVALSEPLQVATKAYTEALVAKLKKGK